MTNERTEGLHHEAYQLSFAVCHRARLRVTSAHAQDKYPSRPVRVMVPFAAGSATDITIRIVGEQLRQQTGQGFVIENKPGVFGILAIEEMARPPYDGYTLQVGNPGINLLTPIHLQGQVQDRLREGSDDGDAARRDSADPCRHHGRLRAQDLRRVHHLRQGEPRQGALRQRRRRLQQSLRHRSLRAVGRHQAARTSRTRAAAAPSPTTCCAATFTSSWSTRRARRAWRRPASSGFWR